jgi:nucleoid-associated protein YgaU
MGEFAIDMTKQEHPGARSGVSGTVTFTANDKAPDAKSIRLTQVVKDLDLDKAPNADYAWTGGEANRNKMMTSDSFEAYTTKAGDTLQSITGESYRVVEGTSATFQATQQKFTEFYKNSHIVMQGETLQTISQKYFGTPDKAKDIYNANKAVIPDQAHLQPGTKLTIPGVTAP